MSTELVTALKAARDWIAERDRSVLEEAAKIIENKEVRFFFNRSPEAIRGVMSAAIRACANQEPTASILAQIDAALERRATFREPPAEEEGRG